jgi:hypothetical protein
MVTFAYNGSFKFSPDTVLGIHFFFEKKMLRYSLAK